MAANVITLEDGWSRLKTGGVKKIEDILEDMKDGVYKDKITTDEYSALYTTVYTMCTQKPPNNWSEHLYNNYCEAVKEILTSRILPRIKEKHDEFMLRELVRRWEKKWVTRGHMTVLKWERVQTDGEANGRGLEKTEVVAAAEPSRKRPRASA